MNEKWHRRKKSRFSLSKDTILGIVVLFAVFVTVIILSHKNNTPNVSDPPKENIINNKVRVVDGDTLEINSEKIRLFGIDAPERGQPCKKNNISYNCGEASKKHLQFIIVGQNVTCDDRGKGRWGRKISICKVGGEDINELMVKHGWAIAYRKYSKKYVSDENFARLNQLGMWSKEFTPPSVWRKLKDKRHER